MNKCKGGFGAGLKSVGGNPIRGEKKLGRVIQVCSAVGNHRRDKNSDQKKIQKSEKDVRDNTKGKV